MSGAATGVTGLEATHEWAELALTSLAKLNDFSAYPVFKLIEIPGFFSTPDMDDNRHAKTGAYGEELVTSFSRGKTFQYHGASLGRTRDECLIGKTTLMSAFGPAPTTGLKVARRMVITPSATLVDSTDPAPSGLVHTFTGVCNKVTMDDAAPRRIKDEGLPPIRWAIPFALEMRITDGLFWQWDTTTLVQSNPKFA